MNAFVVESPTQLLNAMEACHHFGLSRSMLIVLLTGLFEKSYYERIIRKDEWGAVKYVKFFYCGRQFDFGKARPRNLYERSVELYLVFDQFLRRHRLDRLAKSIGWAENLFLGNYRNDASFHMRHFANKVAFGRLILVDDGTDTLLINEQRKTESSRNGEEVDGHVRFFAALKKVMRRRFVDWDTCGVKSLTFFTPYDIKVNNSDRVEKNDYTYLRSFIKGGSPSQEVIFLGQPLVDDGYVTLDVFIDCLKRVKEHFMETPLVYVPHPRESEKYTEKVERELSITVVKLDVPIEYKLTVGGWQAKCVASFFCSALENLAVIFKNSVDVLAFYLRQEELLKNHQVVNDVYLHLMARKEKNIRVIWGNW